MLVTFNRDGGEGLFYVVGVLMALNIVELDLDGLHLLDSELFFSDNRDN